ncbi:hypothetical protein S245_050001 [Arachis hypogaea]
MNYQIRSLLSSSCEHKRGRGAKHTSAHKSSPPFLSARQYQLHRASRCWWVHHRSTSSFRLLLPWIKLPAELKLMKEAASVACQALLLTMLHSKTYPFESMLGAKVEYECRMKGAQRMG